MAGPRVRSKDSKDSKDKGEDSYIVKALKGGMNSANKAIADAKRKGLLGSRNQVVQEEKDSKPRKRRQ